jgi:hypothetical protein
MFDALPPHKDVFILGAGFSRAISGLMPLTDELGDACLAFDELHNARGVPRKFRGGRFETWLSSIAEPQPYQPEPRNLENQALFARFSDAIGQVLGWRMDAVLANPPPRWLSKFVTAAHVRRATVISFNYDTLLECAVLHRDIWLPTLVEPVAWTEVTGDVPGWPAGAARYGAAAAATFRLLKLHGSLNWYWIPGDTTGVSVARRPLPGTFTASQPYTEEDRRRQLLARTPFVVPPSATKSSYYQNPLVRELWMQAGEALSAASRVALMGYSLPQTDLTASSMLEWTLSGSQVPVRVVDLHPQPVANRLTALGVEADVSSGSPSTVEDHVNRYCEAISRALVDDLRRSSAFPSNDAPLLVAWGADTVSTVVGLRAEGDALVLEVEPPQPLEAAVRRSADPLPTLAQAIADTAVNDHWLVRLDGSPDAEVLDRVDYSHDTGYGTGRWNVLLPSAGRQ